MTATVRAKLGLVERGKRDHVVVPNRDQQRLALLVAQLADHNLVINRENVFRKHGITRDSEDVGKAGFKACAYSKKGQ